jgi:leucyl aminopeptidase
MAFRKWHHHACTVKPCQDFETTDDYDALVVVSQDLEHAKNVGGKYSATIKMMRGIDHAFEKEVSVLPLNISNIKGPTRLVFSPTGPLDRDYDDVRRYADATAKGLKRAISAGSRRPLLIVEPDSKYPNAALVSLLSALEVLYVPLHFREVDKESGSKVDVLGLYGSNEQEVNRIISVATSLEAGRYVARDIGGGDPERMAPPRVAEYIEDLFKDTAVSVEVIEDRKVFEKEYPLFAAVDRAASVIERHRGRIIFLRYEGEGPITRTVMPVGKGITYDTGGADIKAGGHMAGMSRDKCGAAAVAGFFYSLAKFRPAGIKAIGALAVARNSVGENCYVADEIIVSRAGSRIRIGNTDAEGRMVMTDVLCKMKELALNEKNPYLCTIATLTGHACLAVGPYTAVMDNGPAQAEKIAQTIQCVGAELGDMFEISTIRREDFAFIKKNTGDCEDLLQCNNAPSSQTARGHQFPAAFMIEGSGLDKHGLNSKTPLKYSHFDIAGSGGDIPNNPTGVPIIALCKFHFGDQF